MKTIIVSDLHLGLDDRISENVANRPKLADFIDRVRADGMADELVIAGDFLDQWFYPGNVDLPQDSREFYLACAKNNQVVIDALARLIEAGTPVVYVPGNHDMTMPHDVLAQIVPGIRQVRDVPGLGRYRTGVRGEVVIEHSHRYEIMCAPDTITNAQLMEHGYPMLPPGYFFARVGVSSFAEGVYQDEAARAANRKELPEPPAPDPSDALAVARYTYWKTWAGIINDWFPVREGMDEKFVKVAVDGLVGEFSLSDLLPGVQEDGALRAPLYADIVENWEEVQRRNLVPVPVSAAYSLEHAADNEMRIEELPAREYFDVDPTIDVVVFGHTHVPGYKDFTGYDRPKVFANSGTWVDDNTDDPDNTATFVLVESTEDGDVVQTLKCVGEGKVEDIVPVENDHIRRPRHDNERGICMTDNQHNAPDEVVANTRPYVIDAGKKPEGVVDTATATIGFVLLALVTGFVIGFAVYCIMNVSTWLTELLWNGAGGALGVPWFSLAVCTAGGLAIGLWTWWSKDSVHPLEEVMAQFKETGSYRTNGIVRPVVTFLLPLVFGGSIGFEAGLTGLITAGCCWIRDKLKAAGLRYGAVADVTIAASMSAIFGTPLAGIVAGAESAPEDGQDTLAEPDVNAYDMRRGAKIVLYTAAAFGAFGGIALFSTLFSTSGGLPRFDAITASYAELLWALPCLVVAYVMTLLFHGSTRLFSHLATRLGAGRRGVVLKPVIAGVVMGAVAMALPLVLFPGETQSEDLMRTWGTWSAAALLGTGVLKAVITSLCVEMGWVGGNFFPSIFAGVAAGYGIAALTGTDPMLAVTVTTTAFLAGVVRKPLLVLAVLFLCFPLEGLVWMGLAAIIGAALPVPHALTEWKEA